MKTFVLFTLLICSFTLQANTKIPRQKILLTGAVIAGAPKALGVEQFETLFPKRELKINDPYNKDILTTFYGFPFVDLFNKYADKKVSKVSVKAIDGYKVFIPKENIASEKLFLSYQDNNGYLTVDRMGPGRFIGPYEGIIPKDVLLKMGVNWVWQIKEIEFIK